MTVIKPGDALMVRDATDEWRAATATSGVEGTHRDGRKVHDFPVVWVSLAGYSGPVPWPVEAVVQAESAST